MVNDDRSECPCGEDHRSLGKNIADATFRYAMGAACTALLFLALDDALGTDPGARVLWAGLLATVILFGVHAVVYTWAASRDADEYTDEDAARDREDER